MLTKRLPPWILLFVFGPIVLKTSQLLLGYEDPYPGRFWIIFACAVVLAIVGTSFYVWDWLYHRRRQASSSSKEKPRP